FRWGGEEFLILLPHTSPEEALALAERVRASVARGAIVQEQVASPIHVTVSLGTAGTDAFPADVDAMIATADAACYLAKRAGRSRVGYGSRLLQDSLELPADATWRTAGPRSTSYDSAMRPSLSQFRDRLRVGLERARSSAGRLRQRGAGVPALA